MTLKTFKDFLIEQNEDAEDLEKKGRLSNRKLDELEKFVIQSLKELSNEFTDELIAEVSPEKRRLTLKQTINDQGKALQPNIDDGAGIVREIANLIKERFGQFISKVKENTDLDSPSPIDVVFYGPNKNTVGRIWLYMPGWEDGGWVDFSQPEIHIEYRFSN